MAQLTYNPKSERYEGQTSDGRMVSVKPDEITDNTPDEYIESPEAWDADEWAKVDSDNVQVYCGQCGCLSAVPESAELGEGQECECECHEDGIARPKS